MAGLQGHFMRFKKDPLQAYNMFKSYCEEEIKKEKEKLKEDDKIKEEKVEE